MFHGNMDLCIFQCGSWFTCSWQGIPSFWTVVCGISWDTTLTWFKTNGNGEYAEIFHIDSPASSANLKSFHNIYIFYNCILSPKKHLRVNKKSRSWPTGFVHNMFTQHVAERCGSAATSIGEIMSCSRCRVVGPVVEVMNMGDLWCTQKNTGVIILPILVWIKQYKSMVIFGDFPYYNALFGLVI